MKRSRARSRRTKSKVGSCPYCGRRHSRSYLCEAGFEAWEIDYELREKKDYAGLIAHYKAVVEWESGGPRGLYRLGEAYVLNGEPEKAIELLSGAHRKYPHDEDIQHVILDALFALGKDETDFEWVERMPVYRLDASVLDRCHAYLKPKRKLRDVYDLHGQFIHGYCVFSPEELLEAVRGDDRFVVVEDEFGFSEIRARRKRDGLPPSLIREGEESRR